MIVLQSERENKGHFYDKEWLKHWVSSLLMIWELRPSLRTVARRQGERDGKGNYSVESTTYTH